MEDDQATRESWERDIREFNREPTNSFKFQSIFATSKKEAFDALSRRRVNCAVIDLQLPDGEEGSTATHTWGNDILQIVLEEIGVPAVVYSGFDGDTSAAVRASNIQVISKAGGKSREILDGFASQAALMIAMEFTRKRIAKETARLFNHSIWRRWENRWAQHQDKGLISDIIARQTASHIAAELAQTPVTHHPDEFYIVPALHATRLDTGDLIQQGDEVQVVLTPRCNMARPPSHLMLAICKPVPAWSQWKDKLLTGNGDARRKAVDEIGNYATQGHAIATHFLPPLDNGGPWLVDFKEVRTVKSEEATALLPSRFASIAPHFVPNLVQRYSSYLGRIGQPDINTETLVELCKR